MLFRSQPTNGLSVVANRRQLEEIFFNLVINACHALEVTSPMPQATGRKPQTKDDIAPSSKPQAPSFKPAAGSLKLAAKTLPAAYDLQPEATLSISAERVNGHVKINIEDNGTGIPKQNQKKIFEPFYSTKNEKGSGLGLYITKQLVERNGGKIAVKSKSGEGTRFTLTLPACPAGRPAK